MYFQLIVDVIELALFVYLASIWVVALRCPPMTGTTRKKRLTGLGLGLATISLGIDAYLWAHALMVGGYDVMDPIEVRCIQCGLLAALLGIIAAANGDRKIKNHVVVLSSLTFLLWFWAASTQ